MGFTEQVKPIANPILDFKKNYPVSTRLFIIENDIRKQHGGSVGDIVMCLNSFQADLILHDKSKTLSQVGISTACEASLLYDFKPIQAPMLTTQFNYKTGRDGELD